jgi:predicted transcriptional regulator
MSRGKTTDRQTAETVLLMSEVLGKSNSSIAKETGLTRSTVKDIVNGSCKEWEELRDDRKYQERARTEKRKLQLAWNEITKQALERTAETLDSASAGTAA